MRRIRMTKKANHTPEELRYLARGENTGEIPTAYDPAQHSENEGDIPAPFTGGDSNARQDQTMARLDEAFQARARKSSRRTVRKMAAPTILGKHD
jgi:hypothetical protein